MLNNPVRELLCFFNGFMINMGAVILLARENDRWVDEIFSRADASPSG